MEAQRAAQAPLVARQKTQLAGLPEECLKPLALEVYFERNSNKITKKDDKQLKEIAAFLKANPMMKVRLIGNTAMQKGISNSRTVESDFIEAVETVHLMPDDELPKSFSKEEIDSVRNRSHIVEDLMMIRTHRIKQLFIRMGVNDMQVEPVPGENLGAGKEHQKVIVNFY